MKSEMENENQSALNRDGAERAELVFHEEDDDEVLLNVRAQRIGRTQRWNDDDEEPEHRMPLAVRAVAWLSLLSICVAVGYAGTGWLLDFLDKNTSLHQKNVVADVSELQKLMHVGQDGLEERKEISVYFLGVQGVKSETAKILANTQEDEMIQALTMTFKKSSERWVNEIAPLHVFRDGMMCYIDLPQNFLKGLQKLPEERMQLMLTSVVQTVVQNFQPITGVYFLINGSWVKKVGGFSMSDPWSL